MKNFVVIFSFIVISCSFISKSFAAFDKVVGYYSSWAVYRQGEGRFDIDSIDPHLYTHIIYAFVGIDDNGHIVIKDPGNDAVFKRFTDLKYVNTNLKVLVAIGGGDQTSSQVFSRVSKDWNKRRALIDNAVQFLNQHNFDGFDLDWEYPGANGGDAADKANFALWVREFREEFDKHGFLLTAAVAGPQYQINESYDVPAINDALDFINLMAYDIHGPWSGPTGHNADMSGVRQYVDNWVAAGMNHQNIVLGVPTYGHSYTLVDPGNNGVGAPVTGPGEPGPISNDSGSILYYEVVDYINSGTWTHKYDSENQVPYMHKGNQWISYDDKDSIAIKVQYAKGRDLGGIMVWSVDMDDFRGKSGEFNPLQTTIRNNMKK